MNVPQYLGVLVIETSIFSRHLIARSPSVFSNKRRLTAAAARIFFLKNCRLNCNGSLTATTEDMAAEHYMTQQRLNSVIMRHVHQDIVDAFDISAVAADFTSRTDIRRSIFGNGTF